MLDDGSPIFPSSPLAGSLAVGLSRSKLSDGSAMLMSGSLLSCRLRLLAMSDCMVANGVALKRFIRAPYLLTKSR